MHRVDTRIELDVHADGEHERTEQTRAAGHANVSRSPEMSEDVPGGAETKERDHVEAHVERLPHDGARDALRHARPPCREGPEQQHREPEPAEHAADAHRTSLGSEAEDAKPGEPERSQDGPHRGPPGRHRVLHPVDDFVVGSHEQHVVDEGARTEADEEIDHPRQDRRGCARRHEPHCCVKPIRVRQPRASAHEAPDDERQWRAEDHRGRDARDVETEEHDEREPSEHEEEPGEDPILVPFPGGDERQRETAREDRQHARVLLEGEREPGEDAGKNERRAALPHEIAVEGGLRGEPCSARVPCGVRDVEGRELADEGRQEGHVAEGGHSGEQSTGERTGETEQQCDRGGVHQHEDATQRDY